MKASGATAEKPKHAQSDKGTIWDMLLPLIALIVFAVLALLYDGGYWGKDVCLPHHRCRARQLLRFQSSSLGFLRRFRRCIPHVHSAPRGFFP